VLALEGRELLSTLTVSNTDDSGAGSLRAAISQANSDSGGDTIVFSELFSSPQTITLTGGQLELTGTRAPTTITGPGANLLSVSGHQASRVFLVDANVTASISGLTVTGGNAATSDDDGGGGVQVMENGLLTMTDCTVSDNAASGQSGLGGGLVCFKGGSLTMTNCTVSGNSAVGGGGVSNDAGTLTMTNCTVSGNSAPYGGGVANFGTSGTATLILTDCTVSGNSAKYGGGLDNSSGAATLTNTIVAGNNGGIANVAGSYSGSNNLTGGDPKLAPLGDYGGPSFTMPPLPGSLAVGGGTTTGAPATDQRGQPRTGSIDIGAFQGQGTTLVVNVASDGVGSATGQIGLRQAINLANALSTADTITFSGLFNAPQTITLTAGELVLTDQAMTTIAGPGADLLTVRGKPSSRVFEIRGGSADLSGLTITGGSADHGGGLLNNDGTLSMTNCTVSGNSATGGGGLYSEGGASTLTDCTISGNTANARGGGLLEGQGWLILRGCTVSDNRASIGGGLDDSATNYGGMSLTNCTITGNTAGRYGGGLDSVAPTDTLNLDNCTISLNQCGGYGGGIYSLGRQGFTFLNNTIVAGNAAASGTDDAKISFTGSNNLIGVDALLAPLDNYGGPTPTMALLPGSPAIDTGKADGAPAVDQRGLPRAGHVDIGAFQSQGFTLTAVPGSTPQSAVVGAAFAHPLAVTVTANNPVEPVDGGIVGFAAPASGASAALSAATATIRGGQASVAATASATMGPYRVTAIAAGGGSTSFDLTNAETFSLRLTTPRDVVDQFDGLTSLREAIAYANSHPGPDTITFDPAAFGKRARTIKLIGGPLVLTDKATTTIIGPGARRLRLQGDGKTRVFDIQGGSLALEGVTISGGRADRGGALWNDGGNLALDHVILRGNRARVGGGLFNDGKAVLTNVVFGGNSARVGSGLFSTLKATLTWRRSPGGGRG
jgi:hypothetical protein